MLKSVRVPCYTSDLYEQRRSLIVKSNFQWNKKQTVIVIHNMAGILELRTILYKTSKAGMPS